VITDCGVGLCHRGFCRGETAVLPITVRFPDVFNDPAELSSGFFGFVAKVLGRCVQQVLGITRERAEIGCEVGARAACMRHREIWKTSLHKRILSVAFFDRRLPDGFGAGEKQILSDQAGC